MISPAYSLRHNNSYPFVFINALRITQAQTFISVIYTLGIPCYVINEELYEIKKYIYKCTSKI